ncbi:hypothetical protein H7B90_27520 [Cohnella xylanilytica]|uniref:Uncharacterized protein n=1 Tax=Cohnella xylanilytica TaxID=557555 RepID=A0A841UB08_9BACL|nr:hypothetical protein [Cohnella xylanilytica]MBB6695151.1 hypothetical protein [Cohnella xylanilytica]
MRRLTSHTEPDSFDPMEQRTYGKTAYQAYAGLLENEKDDFTWAILCFSLSLMAADDEFKTALARYALSEAPYNREIFAMGTFGFTAETGTLLEWLKLVVRKRGVSGDARQTIGDFVKELARKESAAEGRGVRSWAERPLTLDLLRTMDLGEAAASLAKLAESPATAAEAVRKLAFFPDATSGKWLRRICRNPDVAPAVQTRALLAMRGLGITGNVKLVKPGREYTVDLGDPELVSDIPAEWMKAYDWAAVWFLRARGSIGPEAFEDYAERGLPFPKELHGETQVVYASPQMEKIKDWLYEAYCHYYPDIPSIAEDERESWGAALLHLLKASSPENVLPLEGEDVPELGEAGSIRLGWLKAAIPELG